MRVAYTTFFYNFSFHSVCLLSQQQTSGTSVYTYLPLHPACDHPNEGLSQNYHHRLRKKPVLVAH